MTTPTPSYSPEHTEQALAMYTAYEQARHHQAGDILTAIIETIGVTDRHEAADLLIDGHRLAVARDEGMQLLAQRALGLTADQVRADLPAAIRRVSELPPEQLAEWLPVVAGLIETGPAELVAVLRHLTIPPSAPPAGWPAGAA